MKGLRRLLAAVEREPVTRNPPSRVSGGVRQTEREGNRSLDAKDSASEAPRKRSRSDLTAKSRKSYLRGVKDDNGKKCRKFKSYLSGNKGGKPNLKDNRGGDGKKCKRRHKKYIGSRCPQWHATKVKEKEARERRRWQAGQRRP